MRRMVEKGLLSDDDVGAIYKEAASKLRGFDQSEARVALSALENKIIPDTKRRAIDTTATKPATISSVTKPSSQRITTRQHSCIRFLSFHHPGDSFYLWCDRGGFLIHRPWG